MRLRFSTVVLVALPLLLVPYRALAVPGESSVSPRAVEEARSRFQRGVQLFREGSFEAALAEFRRAYLIAPSYRLLYNIAQVEFEQKDYVEAIKSFRRYLSEGAGDIPSERRSQVEREIQKLEARIAYLEVATNLDGAQIFVDDVEVGHSPLRAAISVNAGPRRVAVSKEGYGAVARVVSVAGGDRLKVELDLAETNRLRTTADPGTKKVSVVPKAEPVRASAGQSATFVGLAATGVFAVGTGVFALLAFDAKKDFDAELERFPTSRVEIDDARSRLRTYAAVTDGLAAATLVAGGMTLVLALSGGSAKSSAQQGTSTTIRVAPRMGGVTLSGTF
jgi:tetratricopeptide (TPR) repeat protein